MAQAWQDDGGTPVGVEDDVEDGYESDDDDADDGTHFDDPDWIAAQGQQVGGPMGPGRIGDAELQVSAATDARAPTEPERQWDAARVRADYQVQLARQSEEAARLIEHRGVAERDAYRAARDARLLAEQEQRDVESRPLAFADQGYVWSHAAASLAEFEAADADYQHLHDHRGEAGVLPSQLAEASARRKDALSAHAQFEAERKARMAEASIAEHRAAREADPWPDPKSVYNQYVRPAQEDFARRRAEAERLAQEQHDAVMRRLEQAGRTSQLAGEAGRKAKAFGERVLRQAREARERQRLFDREQGRG